MNFHWNPAKTDTLHEYVDHLRQFGQMCKFDENLEHRRYILCCISANIYRQVPIDARGGAGLIK